MTPRQTLRHEQELDDLPAGSVIRAAGFVAEATTPTGRRWATTAGQVLTSAQVLAAGPVTVLDVPADTSTAGDRHLGGILAAQAEVATLTAQRRRAADRLATRIARANEAGMPYQAIADALGISRQRVAFLARQAGR